jgi:glycosyltransferase involved in cell wall biosynthesis
MVTAQATQARRSVSVVIPTHNHASWIGSAVRSVRKNTLDAAEIIVIDDGSSDETRQVVSGLQLGTHYRYQPNRGLAAARNTGLEMATGEFVLFLDSDDLITPAKLERQVRFLLDSRLDAAYSNWAYVDARGDWLARDDCADYTRDMFGALCIANFAPIHSYLFRRSAVESIRGFAEDLDGQGYEDWDLLFRLSLAGCQFGFLPEVTALYRMHSSNMCSVAAETLCVCGLDVLSRVARAADRDEVDLRLARALVHMEACTQLYRRGDVTAARRYAATAFRWYRELAFSELLFHYLTTVDAAPDLGHAAFVLRRHCPPDPVITMYRTVCGEWAADGGVRFAEAELECGVAQLRTWLADDAPTYGESKQR